LRLDLKESGKGFCQRGRTGSVHLERLSTKKGAGTSNEKSGRGNMEAESFGSGADSM